MSKRTVIEIDSDEEDENMECGENKNKNIGKDISVFYDYNVKDMKIMKRGSREHEQLTGDLMYFSAEMVLELRENNILFIPSRFLVDTDTQQKKRKDLYSFTESSLYTLQLMDIYLPLFSNSAKLPYKAIIFPVVQNEYHWSVFVYYRGEEKLFYYDSLRLSDQKEYAKKLIIKMNKICAMGRNSNKKLFSEDTKLTIKIISSFPVQKDGWSCGYYILMLAKMLINNNTLDNTTDYTLDINNACKSHLIQLNKNMLRSYIQQSIVFNENKTRLTEYFFFKKIDQHVYNALIEMRYINCNLLIYLIGKYTGLEMSSWDVFNLGIEDVTQYTIIQHNNRAIALLFKCNTQLSVYAFKDHQIVSRYIGQIETVNIVFFKEELTDFQIDCLIFTFAETCIRSKQMLNRRDSIAICNLFTQQNKYMPDILLNFKKMFLQKLIYHSAQKLQHHQNYKSVFAPVKDRNRLWTVLYNEGAPYCLDIIATHKPRLVKAIQNSSFADIYSILDEIPHCFLSPTGTIMCDIQGVDIMFIETQLLHHRHSTTCIFKNQLLLFPIMIFHDLKQKQFFYTSLSNLSDIRNPNSNNELSTWLNTILSQEGFYMFANYSFLYQIIQIECLDPNIYYKLASLLSTQY